MTITAELQSTITKLAETGKGILAADESTGTITKRFDTIGVESTEENRRLYRDTLFSTTGLGEFICGAILFEETLGQNASTGKTIPALLNEQGIVPGIKVDKGLVDLDGTDGEKTTQGIDGLSDRLKKYKEQGARFAKWRAVYNITDTLPSTTAIEANADGLAQYAAACQAEGIVPIVEPEVLMEGTHTIERCAEATEAVQLAVFVALKQHGVALEHIVLKPSMIIQGQDCATKGTHEEVAEWTLKVLRKTVPATVPTINFLSGGQSDEDATLHLQLMNAAKGDKPWHLSYSYGRALQTPALKAWLGDVANTKATQDALYKRAKLNSAAVIGKYNSDMEDTAGATA